MRLDGADRHSRYLGYAFYGIAVDELQRHAGAFLFGKSGERSVNVHLHALFAVVGASVSHSRTVRIGGGTLSAVMVVEHVAGYTIQPSGERRRTLKLVYVGVSLNEGVLREVVAQLLVSQSLVEEESSYRRLILPDKLIESRFVMKSSHL